MDAPATPVTPAAAPRGLRRFAVFTVVACTFLLFAGGYTTSIGAGMVFSDWPTSNGSFNPDGWLTHEAMRAEHGHRLTGALVGLLVFFLTGWTLRREERRWVRRLAVWLSVLVVLQGLLGGLRVRLDSHPVSWLGEGTTGGLVFRVLHGCLAQVFFSLLVLTAAALSRSWRACALGRPRAVAIAAWGMVALALGQLVVAVLMRHQHAGLAIPTFPLTPEGRFIPSHWEAGVALHFSHRAIALALLFFVPWWTLLSGTSVGHTRGWARAGRGLLALLALQVLLGAATVWTGRHPWVATAHVITGAGLLALLLVVAVAASSGRTAAAPSPATPA